MYYRILVLALLISLPSAFALIEEPQPVFDGESVYFNSTYLDLYVDKAVGYQDLPGDSIRQGFTVSLHDISSADVYAAYVFSEPLQSGSVTRGGVDKTSLFSHTTYSGYDVYHLSSPVTLSNGDDLSLNLSYVPNENDNSKKWDLYFYTGPSADCFKTSSCNYFVKFDPWWNTTFDRKVQVNFTMSDSSLNPQIILNSSNINYSEINDDGSDLRVVNSAETELMKFNLTEYNESGNSKVTIFNAGNFSNTTNTIWIYHKNNTPVNSESQPVDILTGVNQTNVAYYTFDNTLLDSTGNNNDLTDGTNAFSTSAGKINEAYNFPNNPSYLSASDSSSLDLSGGWALNAWVNASILNGSIHSVVVKNFDGSNVPYSMRIIEDTGNYVLQCGFYDGSWREEAGSVNLQTGSFYMLTCDYDGSTLRGYVDNSLDLSLSYSGSVPTTNTDLTIGARGDWNGGYQSVSQFYGVIDEVGVWSDFLNSTEREELYNSGKGRQYPFSLFEIVSPSFSQTFINNVPPSLTDVSFNPSTPSVVDDLDVEFTVLDDDGDSVNVSAEWFKNNVSILNDSSGFLANGTQSSFTLLKGNYSVDDLINVTLTPFDNNSNQGDSARLNVTILGSPTKAISNLSLVDKGKTWVKFSWDNPDTDFNSTEGQRNGTTIFNLNVSEYNFTGLDPNTNYNFSFYTWSSSGARNNSPVSSAQTTDSNPPPTIDDFSPSDTTPTFQENTTQTFNVTASDDDGTVWYRWILDGVTQAFTQAWDYVIGLTDEGSHNVTVVVNDTFNDTTRQEWSVTVEDTFPSPQKPKLFIHGNKFKYNIPVTCREDTQEIRTYYDLDYRVNNGSWNSLQSDDTVCYSVLDITSYEFGTNFSFRARASNEAGTSNYTVSDNYQKANKNLFYLYEPGGVSPKYSFVPYELGFVADFSNNNSIYISNSFVDCNGDGFFDYSTDYNETNPDRLPTKVTDTFTCVNYVGTVDHTIGVAFRSLTETTDWSQVGCEAREGREYCVITKDYEVRIR